MAKVPAIAQALASAAAKDDVIFQVMTLKAAPFKGLETACVTAGKTGMSFERFFSTQAQGTQATARAAAAALYHGMGNLRLDFNACASFTAMCQAAITEYRGRIEGFKAYGGRVLDDRVGSLLASAIRHCEPEARDSKAYMSASHLIHDVVVGLETNSDLPDEMLRVYCDRFASRLLTRPGDERILGPVLYDPSARKLANLQKRLEKGAAKPALAKAATMSAGSNGPASEDSCLLCGGVGHRYKDCTASVDTRGEEIVGKARGSDGKFIPKKCWGCKFHGHVVRTCPSSKSSGSKSGKGSPTKGAAAKVGKAASLPLNCEAPPSQPVMGEE